MKYLLLIGLVLVILWFFRRPENRSRTGGSPAARHPERMVKCARCGIHLPESESLRDGASYYCCAEHRDSTPDGAD